MPRSRSLLAAIVSFAIGAGGVLGVSSTALAGTSYTAGTPSVDTVSAGPWNTSQGDASAGSAYQEADLLPTFTPGGNETTLGGLSEPNLAVYPSATLPEKETITEPYPSGVAGTPGPLDGYCTSLGAYPETGAPVTQPAGSLPFSPYYFPDVVRNSDGSLTGYFDYRPKDAEEAITVARSTNEGKTWTSGGKALGENHGYCPTADTNDDGQGHPYVTQVGSSTNLYTLQRPAGDYEGVGLLVHHVSPAAANPLEGLPANQSVGVDPNTFAGEEVSVPTSGAGVNIPVPMLGEAGSPEHIVAGPYEDANAASPSSAILTCKGTSTTPAALTGCTVAATEALTVHTGDDLLQVIATANPEGEKPSAKTYTIPAGPNKPSGEGGLATIRFLNGNATESPITTYVMNINAPNRVYIDGVTVYCSQANANPTTKIEDCTNTSGAPLIVHQGDAITADPIVPPGTTMTTGLLAPDGIVGTLPKYPRAPEGSTVVLYTEKILNYFVVGRTNGSVSGSTYKSGAVTLPALTINYTPSVTAAEPLPKVGSFSIYVGAKESSIQQVTCTGVSTSVPSGAPAGSEDLTGCTGGGGSVPVEAFIGGPNAAITPYSALEKIAEGKNGKTSGPEKLFGNNEDYTVLRAAYTTDGVNFTDLGAISGATSGTGSTSGAYNDLSNPDQQNSPNSSSEPTTATPTPTSPTNLAPGSEDAIELRYIGSRGTIITNPDGSYGMFLSGSWASDGDSDAFNQIFYSESTNGQEWSVPKVVLSTDYTFAASVAQDQALSEGKDQPLGVSAYYEGRAYGPAVVQNMNGSLSMVFAGYRLPKPIEPAGTKLGTNASAQYTVGAKDPALYRNILTVPLSSSSSPAVATTTSLSSSDSGTGTVGAPVTYTAIVAPVSPGAGTPTGTVSFSTASGTISGCASQPLVAGSGDSATCATTHPSTGGSEEIKASYSGDSNYAGSSDTISEAVQEAAEITSADHATFNEGAPGAFTVTATGFPAPTVSESGQLPQGVAFDEATGELSGTPTEEGAFHFTFTAHNGVGADAQQSFTLTVDAPPAITSPSGAAFTEGAAGAFTVTATGTPTPIITESGPLPAGVSFDQATGELSGTPTQQGEFPITLEASNGVGSNALQSFTLTVDAASVITSADHATFNEGAPGAFTVTATGFPAPTIAEAGSLPAGVSFEPFSDTLSGTPTEEGVFQITFTAHNGVGADTQQSFTLTVERAAGDHLAQQRHLQRPRSQHLHGHRHWHPEADDHQVGEPPRRLDVRKRGVVRHTNSDRQLRDHLHRLKRRRSEQHPAVHAESAGTAHHDSLAAGSDSQRALQPSTAGSRRRPPVQMESGAAHAAVGPETEQRRPAVRDREFQKIPARRLLPDPSHGHRLD